jgi:Ca-activated chloride channel homolog
MNLFGLLFASPFALMLLGVLPVYGWWWWRHYRPKRLRLTLSYDPSTAASGASRLAWLRHVPPALTLAALVTMILALARPQAVVPAARAEQDGIDIVLAIDVSESMDANDIQPSRLEAAKFAAKDFVIGRKTDRVSLIAFGQDALLLSPLTTDMDFVSTLLDEVRPTLLPRKGTALGNALGLAYVRLAERKGTRIVVLITDGVNNRGLLDPISAAKLLAERGVKVYTMGVGRTIKGREEDFDAGALREVARLTGGRYFAAADAGAVNEVFGAIDGLTRSSAEVTLTRSVVDLYPWFLLAGLVLLCSAFGLMALGLANPLEG